ncbi:MAG: hypothetical protein RLZZ436_1007 [Planctomycetota bacterium]
MKPPRTFQLILLAFLAALPSAAAQNAPAPPAAPATTAPVPGPPATPAATPAPTAADKTSPPVSQPPAASQTTGTAAPAPDPVIPLQDRPYRVTVEVAFSGAVIPAPHHRLQLVSQIRAGFGRMYGGMWDATVHESAWFRPGTRLQLERLTENDLREAWPEAAAEKLLLISVECGQAGFTVSCREYDTRIQELSPSLTRSVFTSQSVAHAACELGRDCFRPILLYSSPTIDKAELEFVLQAGNLLPPDPSAAQIAKGDVLRTFLRQMDRKNPGKVKLLQRLDLCYIQVTDFNRVLGTAGFSQDDSPVTVPDAAEPSTNYTDTARVRGLLLSHGPVPFGGKGGRNLQQIAVRQRPMAPTSRVRLVLRDRPDRPLVCIRVDQVPKRDSPPELRVRHLTDRSGELELSVDPANPTCWLYAYSGSTLLARVPYAPGVMPQETVKLPDDSIRLGVEGDLYLLRDELVDMVAEKAVYMSIAKKASAAGDKQAFENAVTSIDALPARQQFSDRLDAIRSPALQKADAVRNATAKRRIESLITKMRESVDKFFAADKRVKEADELQKLRQAAGLPPAATAPTNPPAPAP